VLGTLRDKRMLMLFFCLKPDNLTLHSQRIFVMMILSLKKLFWNVSILLMGLVLQHCNQSQASNKQKLNDMNSDIKENNPAYSRNDSSKVTLSDDEWRKILPKDIYKVARLKGTETPWTSKYESSHEVGTYYCAVCGNPLFKSDTKFESGCGWPSFYEAISKTSIVYLEDNSFGMKRTEVECGRCKSHLGHLFNDGPPPTGLRYCINGVVLDFEKAKDAEKKYNAENPK
jgi:peptide-methionine (R)-S-oxide reductase